MIRGGSALPTEVIFSSSGQKIISAWNDYKIRIYDVTMGEMSQSLLSGHFNSILYLACSSNDERIISGSEDGTIRIWNAETGEMVQKLSRDVASS